MSPADDYDGGGPNSGYVDKVVFYGCQFVGNEIGADMRARRGNNYNSFTNCRFEDNTENAIYATSSNGLQLINSDIINNGGDPTVYGVSDIISSYFRADERGESFLRGGRTEGTRFERGSSTTARIYSHSDDVFWSNNMNWWGYYDTFMANSSADDIEVGAVNFGVFLNNDLRQRPDLSKPAVTVFPEVTEAPTVGYRPASFNVVTLVDGEVEPGPQLLVTHVPGGPVEAPDAGTMGDGGAGDAGPSSPGTGPDAAGGCGCRTTTSGSGGSLALLLLVGALLRRRRRT